MTLILSIHMSTISNVNTLIGQFLFSIQEKDALENAKDLSQLILVSRLYRTEFSPLLSKAFKAMPSGPFIKAVREGKTNFVLKLLKWKPEFARIKVGIAPALYTAVRRLNNRKIIEALIPLTNLTQTFGPKNKTYRVLAAEKYKDAFPEIEDLFRKSSS